MYKFTYLSKADQEAGVQKYKTIVDYCRAKFLTKTPRIVGNPGASPNYRSLTESGIDSLVVFEQKFSSSQERVHYRPKKIF